jgi:hypothetical protein
MRELTDDGGTGDAQVDEAVRALDTLDGLPVYEHAAVFERVHQVLQDRLTGEPDDDAEGAGDQDTGDQDTGDQDAGDQGTAGGQGTPAGGVARMGYEDRPAAPGPAGQAQGDEWGAGDAGPAGGEG